MQATFRRMISSELHGELIGKRSAGISHNFVVNNVSYSNRIYLERNKRVLSLTFSQFMSFAVCNSMTSFVGPHYVLYPRPLKGPHWVWLQFS